MNNICVVYYDMLEIDPEIKSVVNINHFGNLFYKKQKLVQYHENIFKENGITVFCHIRSESDLQKFIVYYSYANVNEFIFLTSSFTVVVPSLFSDFLQRIRYIESSLAIFEHDNIKSFLKLNKKELVSLLELLSLDNKNVHAIIRQNFGYLEKFRLEKFYLEVNGYVDLVNFLQTNFELRFFNSIQNSGYAITKKSTQKDKMLREFTYYDFVPDDIKYYFLRPFAFSETADHAQYSLERLNIPDLAVQWIHFSIDTVQLKTLMERVFTFIKNRPVKKVTVIDAASVASSLYIDKLSERLRIFKETGLYERINSIVTHATKYDGVEWIFDRYNELYGRLVSQSKTKDELVFSHGDLCFSNILYDKRIDFIKFIDPKGCIKAEDAYMDRYYDVAKLSHSILGHYDFINNGLFEIHFENDMDVTLEIQKQERDDKYEIIFRNFLTEYNFEYKLVRLFEASLFLSMLPLHLDYPKKVLAFILTAINIIDEVEKT